MHADERKTVNTVVWFNLKRPVFEVICVYLVLSVFNDIFDFQGWSLEAVLFVAYNNCQSAMIFSTDFRSRVR
jgi:hypothetical protein